jgi:putative transposase
MLTQQEFKQWSQQLGLGETTELAIADIRSLPPTRRVTSRAGNVSGRYPSRKMGVTIQFESHTVELAGIYQMEYDSDVLEYYDQPPSIQLLYLSKKKRRVKVFHTPDFFVLRQRCAGWEEWKTTQELEKLAQKMPNRYVFDGDNRWRCPPAEDYAQAMGLYYRLRTNAEIDWVVQNNLQFLEDYFRGSIAAVEEKQQAKIYSQVREKPGITVAQLISQGCQPDDIYNMFVQRQLDIDIHTANLSNSSDRVKVFINGQRHLTERIQLKTKPSSIAANRIELNVGSKLLWNGRYLKIINIGETHTAFLSEESKVIQIPNQELSNLITTGEITCVDLNSDTSETKIDRLLAKSSELDCAEANRRASIIAPYLNGKKARDDEKNASASDSVSSRTIRRWLAQWREAERDYGYGYLGLLPQTHQKGNRNRKLPDSTQALICEFIANDYETYKQKGARAVYGALVKACEKDGTTPPSYKTFLVECNNRSKYSQTKKRQGSRAAYQHEPFYWELELTTPRHGNRPWEICHIDHTQLDLELVSSRTGALLGRPWATFLLDAYSRRILAVYLTFESPSYRSCMMVIRECVRRHGRLPQCVVVDGGTEFASVYFERLLAMYECTNKTRPAAKPRFGSVCERLFGTANTMFIHNLAGNTQITRSPRQVTKAVNPRTHAVWTLLSLYESLCNWAYKFYDNKEHPALGTSPRNAYCTNLEQTGWRKHRGISYDETFRILTLPTTKKGTAKVIPNQGVKINHIYYWHNSFRNSEIEKTIVSVRYDPYDAGIAYVYVKGQWVSCISQYYSSFHGRSEREIFLATEELRQQYKQHSQKFTITAKALANFRINNLVLFSGVLDSLCFHFGQHMVQVT